MKHDEHKSFEVHGKRTKKDYDESGNNICEINNSACNQEDGCMTGLVDKTGAF